MRIQINPSLGLGRPGAIVIVPLAEEVAEMHVRQFKLPLARMLALKEQARGGGTVPGNADPFAATGAQTLSDMDLLKAQGIAFPEGSVARYDRDSQMLVVSNSKPNLDLVEQLVTNLTSRDEFEEFMSSQNESSNGVGANPAVYYVDKMSKLIFPSVQFNGASIEEALEFLRIKSREVDYVERDPAKKGVNLIIKPGYAPSTATISLDLKDVPMSEALRYVTELGGMKYKVEPFAVVVVPISDVGTEMYTRTFKVPPHFLLDENGSPRKSAKDVLMAQGIPFPEGSSAVFVPATSQVVVRNTQPSLDLVDAFLSVVCEFPPSEEFIRAAFKRSKAGLVPLELELPTTGQVLSLAGHQRAKELTLHYLSWERQMARTSLLVLLGIALFWNVGRERVRLTTFVAVLLLTCVPVLLFPSWSLTCHALLTGWLLALGVWLLWRVASWWKRRTEGSETVSGKEVVV
jgi:hypothetical protein